MSFLRDVRYSLRSLGRTPGLSGMLVTTVAVGIGTHAALSGFTNGLLARNAVAAGGHAVASIQWHAGAERALPVPFSAFAQLRGASSFDAVAAVRESRVRVTLDGRDAWMTSAAATPDLWKVLDVRPALGAITFAPARGAIGVVASYRLWRNELNARTDAVGMDIVVSGRRGKIVGVAPESFEGIYLGRAIDVWVPLDEQGQSRGVSGARPAEAVRDDCERAGGRDHAGRTGSRPDARALLGRRAGRRIEVRAVAEPADVGVAARAADRRRQRRGFPPVARVPARARDGREDRARRDAHAAGRGDRRR